MQNSSSRFWAGIRPFIGVAAALVLWWMLSGLHWVNPLFLPMPGSVFAAMLKLLLGKEFFTGAAATIYRSVLGLFLSALVAIPLGLVLGRSIRLYQLFELPMDFFRSIPSSALFFLFILAFGISDASKVAVVFYGCSLILLINTIYGARPTREKQDRINMLRSFGATRWQVFTIAIVRDAMPHILAGVRVCVSLSLVLVIVTEMFLSANNGLGRQIYDFYLAYRVPEMYAVIILLGLLGYAANKLCAVFERRAVFWLPIHNWVVS